MRFSLFPGEGQKKNNNGKKDLGSSPLNQGPSHWTLPLSSAINNTHKGLAHGHNYYY